MIHFWLASENKGKKHPNLTFFYFVKEGEKEQYSYFDQIVKEYELKYFQRWWKTGINTHEPCRYNTEKCEGMV